MHLANLTTAGIKRIFVLILSVSIYSFASAQENSPYSRYGIGDIVPNQNVLNRGMGGISAGYTNLNYVDFKYITPGILFQSINLVNPASLASLNNTVFDVAGEVDIRTLKSTTSPAKYTATNTLISYLQLGFPLASEKMRKKGIYWGASFGLRPISRINYKIEKNERLSGIDSLNTMYEGSGGLNQVNIGTGLKIKNFSIGLNTGYSFGSKNYSTKLNFINDTVLYYKSNSEAKSRFGGFFLDLGMQYMIKLKGGVLNLGAFGNLQQKLKAKRDYIDETFAYDGNGGTVTIDTVNYKKEENGTVKVPGTYGVGFTYTNYHWLWGVDFETSNWNAYRYYGQQDAVQNSWMIRAGVQYYPLKQTSTASAKYWSYVKYRLGFYYGADYVKLADNRPNYAVTGGAGFPLADMKRLGGGRGEYVLLNTSFEFGARGTKQSLSVRENITRINIGISMNARWFMKRSYD
ncbi:outer membrane protein transport protein [soil metagenome]